MIVFKNLQIIIFMGLISFLGLMLVFMHIKVTYFIFITISAKLTFKHNSNYNVMVYDESSI